MLLICYDGSPDAIRALERSAGLASGVPAVVVTVWEPLIEMRAVRLALAIAAVGDLGDMTEIDRVSQIKAHALAQAGATRAREAGLEASARVLTRRGSIAETILAEARRLPASTIVVGAGRRPRLTGGLSRQVVRHARCRVLVAQSETARTPLTMAAR